MRGFSSIGLHMPKDNLNVGSVLRAAKCYGVSVVAITGTRYSRARTDTTKAYGSIPLIRCDDLKTCIPYATVPVAVEFISSARNLIGYHHPESAFYVFGPEDGTLGEKVLGWCRDVIYVPTSYCMNLAATVNVILYDRMAKQAACKPVRNLA